MLLLSITYYVFLHMQLYTSHYIINELHTYISEFDPPPPPFPASYATSIVHGMHLMYIYICICKANKQKGRIVNHTFERKISRCNKSLQVMLSFYIKLCVRMCSFWGGRCVFFFGNYITFFFSPLF